MRLFIAIYVPQQIKRQLSDYAESLGMLAEHAHVTREDNLHLTLAFLGDALPEPVACAALDTVCALPFKLYSDKPGCFKSGNNGIYWLGLKSSVELTELHTRLVNALSVVGFAGENQQYTPHLTLAREVRGLDLAQVPAPPRFIIPVQGLVLMESARVNGLLTYSVRYERCFK